MSLVKSFKVGDVAVEAIQPSAVLQDELLGLMTTKIYVAAQVAAKAGTDLGVKECAFMLMTIPAAEKRRMTEILTDGVTIAGSNGKVKVSVKDFQGKMVLWNTLLAELLLWNFADFFDYLSADLAQSRQAELKSETETEEQA